MDCLISEYCCIPNKLLWHIYKIIFALHPDDAFFILFSVLLFKLNKVTERMLPCGTPSSWLYMSDKVPPILTEFF